MNTDRRLHLTVDVKYGEIGSDTASALFARRSGISRVVSRITLSDAGVVTREAAERQILNFDRALAGRPLEGHRLDSVVALVERLKAGLGTSLNGLSEDARITALDWSVSIETGAAGEPGSVTRRISLAHAAGA